MRAASADFSATERRFSTAASFPSPACDAITGRWRIPCARIFSMHSPTDVVTLTVTILAIGVIRSATMAWSVEPSASALTNRAPT